MQSNSKSSNQPQWHLLPLTGISPTDIQQKSIALTRYTQQHPQVALDMIASFLGQEDMSGAFRKAIVVNNAEYLMEQLAKIDADETAGDITSQKSRIVFMFPGIGDHYLQMGRGLYETIPYFQEVFHKCDIELQPFLGESLVDLLYPQESIAIEATTTGLDLAAMLGRKQTATVTDNSSESRIQETAVAHPLVFSIEYALAKLLQHWGVHPQALVGYSLGEYVAATISGVLTLKDALSLVAQRAILIQSLPTGKMLATPLSKDAVIPYLNESVSLSAHNGENLTILAGETDAILAVQQKLLKQQIACRLLDTTHAFHSHMMQEAADELTCLAQSVTYALPQIPYLSNVTGTWITARQAMDPAYWAQHMCHPVQCFTMLRNLLDAEPTCQLIEVGPGQSLGSFIKQHSHCKQEQFGLTHPTLRYSYDYQDDHWFLLSTIRKLWLSGVDLHWKRILPEYSNELLEEEQPLVFAAEQARSTQVTQQRNRGEKRRQKRMRRKGTRNKRISG